MSFFSLSVLSAARQDQFAKLKLMRSMIRRGVVLAILAAISMPSPAAELPGRVVHVIDGDSLSALPPGIP